jgi:hypothetical protein
MSQSSRSSLRPLAPNSISGWELRWVLTVVLADRRGVVSVQELGRQLERDGFSLNGRPSQVISDALRLEVAKGRVERVARGRYRFVGMPKTTASRFRAGARRVTQLRAFATVRARRS